VTAQQVLAYVYMTLVFFGAIGFICYSLSRRNAYRTDGIDNLGGVLRRWVDKKMAKSKPVPVDDGLAYYGYDGSTAWAFRNAEELSVWASEHPSGTWDVQVRER